MILDSIIDTKSIPKTPVVTSFTLLGAVAGGIITVSKKNATFMQGVTWIGGGALAGLALGFVFYAIMEEAQKQKAVSKIAASTTRDGNSLNQPEKTGYDVLMAGSAKPATKASTAPTRLTH